MYLKAQKLGLLGYTPEGSKAAELAQWPQIVNFCPDKGKAPVPVVLFHGIISPYSYFEERLLQ